MSAPELDTDQVAGSKPKQDPESLVLRGTPRPVVRFRRGLLIGAAALGLTAFSAVAWMALQPVTFRNVAAEEEASPRGQAPPEALAGTPSGYGDVPQLGPPLPGDLGRPILEHQRSVADPAMAREASGVDAAEAAREAERERLRAAKLAAASAPVLVQLRPRPAMGGADRPDEPARASEDAEVQTEERSGNQPQARMFSAGEASDRRLVPPPSPWLLAAGTIIPASLITGLNSDLPGMIVAQVTEEVRDSATGRTVLIPRGARLLGSYDRVEAFGQSRALLIWQRLLLPDGGSVRLDDMPAADAQGFAGVSDRVDFHSGRLVTGIALSTLLGVGTQLSLGSGEGDLVRALRESAQQEAARAGDQLTRRNLEIRPTIRVRPGWPVRAIVHKDLILQPWREEP